MKPISQGSSTGIPSDRAANLPIAPPGALDIPTDAIAAHAAVRDGSLDLDLLTRLESEAAQIPAQPR